MQYLKVEWLHEKPNDPVELYSEIDEERWELRKIEVYSDGHAGCADRAQEHGGTRLGVEPLPSIAEIASDSQFRPAVIDQREFEDIWRRFVSRTID